MLIEIIFQLRHLCWFHNPHVDLTNRGSLISHMASSPTLIPVLMAEIAPVQSFSAIASSSFACSSVQKMFTCEPSDTYPVSLSFARWLNSCGSTSEAWSSKQSNLARLNSSIIIRFDPLTSPLISRASPRSLQKIARPANWFQSSCRVTFILVFQGAFVLWVEPIAQFVAVMGLVYFGIGVVLTIMHDRHMIKRTGAGRE